MITRLRPTEEFFLDFPWLAPDEGGAEPAPQHARADPPARSRTGGEPADGGIDCVKEGQGLREWADRQPLK